MSFAPEGARTNPESLTVDKFHVGAPQKGLAQPFAVSCINPESHFSYFPFSNRHRHLVCCPRAASPLAHTAGVSWLAAPQHQPHPGRTWNKRSKEPLTSIPTQGNCFILGSQESQLCPEVSRENADVATHCQISSAQLLRFFCTTLFSPVFHWKAITQKQRKSVKPFTSNKYWDCRRLNKGQGLGI